MQYLEIRNVGPIESVQIELKRFNVFIGAQSIGKSTIAKIFSTCSWLEKEAATNMDEKLVGTGDDFKTILGSFHKMEGYLDVNAPSYIQYETDSVCIIYENNHLSVKLKDDSDYFRQKICYIPSERNMVILPELQGFEFGETNLRSFLFDWFKAREYYNGDNKADVMGLGVKYYFNKDEKRFKDRIEHENGQAYEISLACASSGLQSVIPLYVMLDYYSGEYFNTFSEKISFEMDDKSIQRRMMLTDKIVLEHFYPGFSREERLQRIKDVNNRLHEGDAEVMTVMKDYMAAVERLSRPERTTFIIEEPEQNLFPDTQLELMNTLIKLCQQERKHHFTLTTHSPYIVNYLNVLMRRGKDDISHIDADDLNVFRVYDGRLQNLMSKDLDTGEWVVDTMGLSEQMIDIYNEYDALGV